MQLLLATILGLIAGLLLGVLGSVLLLRSGKLGWAFPLETDLPELDAQTVDVLTAMRDAVAVIGIHDDVLFSSPQARSFGIIRGTRVGFPEVSQMVRRVREDHATAQIDLEIARGWGVPVLKLNVRASFVRPEEVLIFAQEVGARTRVDETRRDFIANVTHELKTPIGALTLLSEAITEGADDPESVRHFAARISHESSRLAELVSQIINLSRLQADEPLLSAEVVRMADVIADVLSRCEEMAQLHHITLVLNTDEAATVVGDADQLADAIANLVTNAIAYSDDSTRVAITTRQVREGDDDFVEVSVADSGIGIKPEDQDRIFERFYRVDYARSRENGGTGLGLAIVKHIAAAHGGTVSVWSQVGEGSTFTLQIPAHIEQANAELEAKPS